MPPRSQALRADLRDLSPPRVLDLPAVDERLVVPETRFEIVGGVVSEVPPAKEEHGSAHLDLATMLRLHLAPGYKAALDMLTRTDGDSDFAPDVSVFEIARDPLTRGRKVEELAFEVCDTATPKRIEDKVRRLISRGVRRVFALDLRRRRVLEWRRGRGAGWQALPAEGAITDPRCLALPLPVRALLDAARVDDAAARALLARRNPVLVAKLAASEARGREEGREEGQEEGREQGREEGREEGRAALRDAVTALCSVLEIELDARKRARLAGLGARELASLVARLRARRAWPD